MKIKIVQQGWEKFTGTFGVVEFVDGVSVNDVSRTEAQCLAAAVSIVNLEGKDPSAAQAIIDTNPTPAKVASILTEDLVEKPPAVTYTADQLAEIADKSGIKGLRAIADPLNLRGNSIAELIGKILRVAGAKPEGVPTPVEAQPE